MNKEAGVHLQSMGSRESEPQLSDWTEQNWYATHKYVDSRAVGPKIEEADSNTLHTNLSEECPWADHLFE